MVHEVDLGNAEALSGAWALALLSVALVPSAENVRQFVCGVLVGTQRGLRNRTKLLLRQQRDALVVERPTIGITIVEPYLVGAARVGLGEQQYSGGGSGVRLEHPARQ